MPCTPHSQTHHDHVVVTKDPHISANNLTFNHRVQQTPNTRNVLILLKGLDLYNLPTAARYAEIRTNISSVPKKANYQYSKMAMTPEMQKLANDPNFIVEFAIGDPIPNLTPQNPKTSSDGCCIRMSGVYFNETKRYLMKSCHLSKDDVRILDVDTGRVVLVSHHPGKNPYESLDPLGLGNTEAQHEVHGGEWESACDVTSRHPSMSSFKIRPKSISRHGRQYIKRMHGDGDNAIIMNIGKKSKLSTKSMRPHFEVSKGKDGSEIYTITGDMMERTFTIKNTNNDQVIAQIAKTTKAMVQNAVLGSGSESTIDIASGVDCSTILAIVFGLGQVGCHVVKDVANSYVLDPLKDSLVGGVVEGVPGMESAAGAYTEASNGMIRGSRKVEKFKKFYKDTFK